MLALAVCWAGDAGAANQVDAPATSGGSAPGAQPVPVERYAFGAASGAPARPTAGLVVGMDGALYGTTALGGAWGLGTLYRLEPAGRITVVHDFGGEGDGKLPADRPVVGRDGGLYGTTQGDGGEPSQGGLGVVWRRGAEGSYRVLHVFRGGDRDGSSPAGTLLSASDGKLYGVTQGGGAYGRGVLFRIGVDGGFELLHSFGATGDLGVPAGAPMQARDATLYGVASDGGARGGGGVYRWLESDGERVLASFDPARGDASFPLGLVEGPDTRLYGVSAGGGSFRRAGVYSVDIDDAQRAPAR